VNAAGRDGGGAPMVQVGIVCVTIDDATVLSAARC
jgi:hypothetical protein